MPSPDYLPGARFGIRAFAGDTNIADLDTASQAMRDDIESKMFGYLEGLESALPAAGISNRIFRATDTGRRLFDTGTAWEALGLAVQTSTSSTPVKTGQMMIFFGSATAVTATLPTPKINAIVGIFNDLPAGKVTVTTPSGNIGMDGGIVSSFPLGSYGSVVYLISDGSNWFVLSGRQDSGWVPLTLSGVSAGAEAPSARLRGDRVELRGYCQVAQSATIAAGTTFASLPAGIPDPAVQQEFPTIVYGDDNAGDHTVNFNMLRLTTGGALSLPYNAAGWGFSPQWIYLNPVHYWVL